MPSLLDLSGKQWLELYCGQGGSTKGFQSKFIVSGVDVNPQPRYCGTTFYQADAIEFLYTYAEWIRDTFVGISAGPPCQRYSLTQRIQKNEHPDLIGATRKALEYVGLPFVIENVEEAWEQLIKPVMLCGAMFPPLRTYRHRLFESGGGLVLKAPDHPEHTVPITKMGRPVKNGEFYHAVGNFSSVDVIRDNMEMVWASRDGIREAVPPAYTRYLARQVEWELL
jgi:DNA (cytosine-5)-methyltransferase 1